eukprot:5968034-Lingulodinium_polyedra.AAC.1
MSGFVCDSCDFLCMCVCGCRCLRAVASKTGEAWVPAPPAASRWECVVRATRQNAPIGIGNASASL